MGKTKDIREVVEAELDFDPLVDAADITVKNMNGQVALNGTVVPRTAWAETHIRPGDSIEIVRARQGG